MNCFVRTVAIIGIFLFALPGTSACATGWRLSQATAQVAQDAQHQEIQDQSGLATTTEQPAPSAQQSAPAPAQKDATHQASEDGTPATVIDDCGRETIGKTLTLVKSTDTIVVDGNQQIRTQTKGKSNCPGT